MGPHCGCLLTPRARGGGHCGRLLTPRARGGGKAPTMAVPPGTGSQKVPIYWLTGGETVPSIVPRQGRLGTMVGTASLPVSHKAKTIEKLVTGAFPRP